MKKRRKIFIPVLLIILMAGIYTMYFKKQIDPHQLKVSGNIETTTVNVGFKISGHVNERLVDEGDSVKKGQQIAALETKDLQLNVDNVNAQLLAAQAALAELTNGSRRQDVAVAQAAARSAEADRNNAATEYQRMQQLFIDSAVSAQDRDRSLTTYKTTSARADQAAQQLSLVEEGPRYEEIALATAKLEQAKKQLELAKTQLAYAQIMAPIDGFVLSKNIEPGEYVASGTPIVTIGDLDHVWLKAYIPENELGRVKLGQKVLVTSDTYPNKTYHGYISFISSDAEFTPKNIQTSEERLKLVYRIKIMIENTEHELKPGMPADAVIHLEGDA